MADIKQTINSSFERYAGNVILNRAICDARDLLKPSARMLMYCQLKITNNVPSKPFIKSARVVGDALGHYYEHGDSSCYSTYMRMAKPFAMRYPLEDCQGNSGTLNSTNDEASMRYTELRLSELGYRLFDGIDKETITSWSSNFDKTETYPKVACSKGFYNIVNGTVGLGIAISSSIPQFNLREVNNAMIKLLWNPDIPYDDIACMPDFATGALLLNPNEVKESLRVGVGEAAKLRAVASYDESRRCITITELPYGVYTETISKQIQQLCEEQPDCGIASINDASHKAADYEIYLEKNANPDKVLKLLYKETSLQSFFTIYMTVLDQGHTPVVLGWRELLQAHLNHEAEVYTRGFQFDLRKIKNRIHIIDGLMAAYDAIDEVVQTIKSSSSSSAANLSLQALLNIDEAQAKAILDLKLARLSRLDITKLRDERDKLSREAVHIEAILSDNSLLKKEIERGLREVADKFGDERRTQIINLDTNEAGVPIEARQLQVSLTNKNNLYVVEASSLYVQKRGGAGSKIKTNTGEYIITTLTTDSNQELLMFSKRGLVYHLKVADLVLNQFISAEQCAPLVAGDQICALTALSQMNNGQYILFFTKNGLVKKSALSEYNIKRKSALRAINLDEGDEIVSVIVTNDSKVGVATEMGNFIIITTNDIRPLGRIARGIRAIKLNEDDAVVRARAIPETTTKIISITGDGHFKMSCISDFAIQARATKGAKIHRIESGGWLADFYPLSVDGEILVASTRSCIRLSTREIPTLSRDAGGVQSIKFSSAADNVVGISIY